MQHNDEVQYQNSLSPLIIVATYCNYGIDSFHLFTLLHNRKATTFSAQSLFYDKFEAKCLVLW